MKLADIKLAHYNPRKDLKPGDPEYEKLKRSMEEFDCVEPLVRNKRTERLVGGHQRLKILKEKGIDEFEVSVVDLDEKREKALNIALNKIQGDWDFTKLADLLIELDDGEFDLELTGFDIDEIEDIMNWTPGDNDKEIIHKKLTERFIVPPFSVLDTRQGYWQDRKRAWLSLGIQSELGRGGGLGAVPPNEQTILSKEYTHRERERVASFKNQDKLWAFQRKMSKGQPKGISGRRRGGGYTINADEYAGGSTEAGRGTSIFDPVLCELIYRWFCIPNSKILDSFAGGSVRGIVAGYLVILIGRLPTAVTKIASLYNSIPAS